MLNMILPRAFLIAFLLLSTGCASVSPQPKVQGGSQQSKPMEHVDSKRLNAATLKEQIIQKYKDEKPKVWGETLTGIDRRINTDKKVIALTFDACGGKNGSGYDADLIQYLTEKKIPATLFINSRWIDANYSKFMELARSPLFEIENHGYSHRPLSANGRSAYGIKGTQSVSEIVDEVQMNHQKIQKLTGRAPMFFRSGTAFYDDIGVKVVKELGESPVGYSVLGDAGATYNTEQVKAALLSAKPGSIVIMHMNHPAGFTAEGVKAAIPELIKRGYHFVKLSEFPLMK
jgi:peptidoglycan/xylan/chitin deacetylase (PgdA/CDA1 family)